MLVHVPEVLDAETLARCRRLLEQAEWVDGRETAGHQSEKVKHNLQLREGTPLARELGALVLQALERSPLFISAALPQRVFPPLFNRYCQGMGFGSHVDGALRRLPDGGRLRTDVSATLFLSDPEGYDGGELVVEDTYGSHAIKLPAGDLIVYPASSLHHVSPITRGSRLAAFFWVQSLVADTGARALLYDLDLATIDLGKQLPESPSLLVLTGVYHNLLRRWAQP
jgi:PKHD-type hydroxylase